eukprot:SAG31_NODE_10927_length_1082_cov_1.552391_3_plen_130_part_00
MIPQLTGIQIGYIQNVGPPVLFTEIVGVFARFFPRWPVGEDRKDVDVDHENEEVHWSQSCVPACGIHDSKDSFSAGSQQRAAAWRCCNQFPDRYKTIIQENLAAFFGTPPWLVQLTFLLGKLPMEEIMP